MLEIKPCRPGTNLRRTRDNCACVDDLRAANARAPDPMPFEGMGLEQTGRWPRLTGSTRSGQELSSDSVTMTTKIT